MTLQAPSRLLLDMAVSKATAAQGGSLCGALRTVNSRSGQRHRERATLQRGCCHLTTQNVCFFYTVWVIAATRGVFERARDTCGMLTVMRPVGTLHSHDQVYACGLGRGSGWHLHLTLPEPVVTR